MMTQMYKLYYSVGSAKSSNFVDALKISLALQCFGTGLDISVENSTGILALIDKDSDAVLYNANSIVRFLSFKEDANTSREILEWINWEEKSLSQIVKSENLDFEIIQAEWQLFSESNVSNTFNAASIVIFCSLFKLLSASQNENLSKCSSIKSWLLDWVSKDECVKAIKKAAIATSGTAQIISTKLLLSENYLMHNLKQPVEHPISPSHHKRNVLITSALPYVNNVPHLGNIIGSVLSADVFSRYCKGRNYNCLYICGTDEYGTATETKAIAEKISPRELCDKYNLLHKQTYEWFEIDFDYFGRTCTEKQTEICQDIFLKLYENDYMFEKSLMQLYCEKHNAFLADRFVEGMCPNCQYPDARGDQCDGCSKLLDPLELVKPRCKLDGETPVPRETKHIFFALQKIQPNIEKWLRKAVKDGKWSPNTVSIATNWLKEGLQPRCITRDLVWGTPIPLKGWENKCFYVWFDAPIGYISITGNYMKDWQSWWKPKQNVELYQFMGKDNVAFHSIIFPGTLLGTGDDYVLVKHISTTEFLNYEGGKFSKSRNRGVFGTDAAQTGISPSVWRYYLLSSRPETSDATFSWTEFAQKNNSELLNVLGNFVNRVIKFVFAKFSGIVPLFQVEIGDEPAFKNFISDTQDLLTQYISAMESVKLREGLRIAMNIATRGNIFLQDNKFDNNLLKKEPKKCAKIIGYSVNLIYLLSTLCEPFMPGTAHTILAQLQLPAMHIPDQFTIRLLPGHKLGVPEYLFKRIENEQVGVWKQKFGAENVDS